MIQSIKWGGGKIDIVLTSPFYNTNKHQRKGRTLDNTNDQTKGYPDVRYDVHIDSLTNEEYCSFTDELFCKLDRVLASNGVILYNLSYGAENTECLFMAINSIIMNTPFTVADVICWKKKSAMPNNMNRNRLTRIWEFVFVICRKSEKYTFNCNKKVISVRNSGQNNYENIFNFIEARNNDGICRLNRATYSTEFCEKLLDIYAVNPNTMVYDPFIGSGTTAIACLHKGYGCIGSEISKQQVEYAEKRIKEEESKHNKNTH